MWKELLTVNMIRVKNKSILQKIGITPKAATILTVFFFAVSGVVFTYYYQAVQEDTNFITRVSAYSYEQ